MASFTGSDVLRILTKTKRGKEISLPSGDVMGGDPLPTGCSARRRESPGEWSWWLARAALAYYDGIVVEVYAYRGDRDHRIVEVVSRSASKEGRYHEMAADLDEPAWYPGFFPAYLAAIIGIGVALAAHAGALDDLPDPSDLVSALQELERTRAVDSSASSGRALAEAVAWSSDELACYLQDLLSPHWDKQLITAPSPLPFSLRRIGPNLSAPVSARTTADEPSRASTETDTDTRSSSDEPASWAAPWVAVPSDLAFKGEQAYAELTAAVSRALPTLLVGPTGVGKNMLVNEVLTRHNLLAYTLKGSYGLQDLDILGAIVPSDGSNGSGPAYRWLDGPLAAAWRHAQREKVAIFFDEITRCRRKQLNVLVGALNPTPALMLPPGATLPPPGPSGHFYALTIPTTAEMIICPMENLVFLAAGNLGGQYAVEPLDPALESRFTCQIELGYLDEDNEVALVVERSGLPAPIARKLVVVAAETRRLWHNAELSSALDPRRLLAWANQVQHARRTTGGDRNLIQVVVATARLTWLTSVVGRDHRGMLHDGRAAGMEDFIETVCQQGGGA